MKDEDKTKAELIKELKFLREEREKGVFKGIAPLKQAEEELRKSEEKWRSLVNILPDHVSLLDLEGRFLFLNHYAEGFTEKEVIGSSVYQYFSPESNEIFKKEMAECQNTKKMRKFEHTAMGDHGIMKKYEDYLVPLLENKQVTSVIVISRNITERKQAEDKLKDSEEYFKILFDYAPDAYYIHDLKGNFIDVNLAAEKIIGRKREELIGNNFLKLKLLSAKDMPKATKSLAKNIMGLPTGPEEYVLNRKDKSTVTVEISNYPVKIKGKTLVLGIARDVTERKQAEMAIIYEENLLHALMDNISDTVYFKDKEKRFIRVNKVKAEHSEVTPEEMIGKTDFDFFPPEIAKQSSADDDLVIKFAKPIIDKVEKIIYSDKTEHWVSTTKVPWYNSEGKIIGTIGITRDITERKQAEERIKHLNLVLYAIRKVNQLIVKEKNRERLLKGACNNLIKTRGYYHTRIVLLDEERKIDTYTEAGLGKDFLPLVKILKKGEMTPCGRLALIKSDVVTIKDPASACPDCPLVQACSARGSAMTVRLEYGSMIYGIMSVSIPVHFITDKEEQALFKEVTGDIALGLHSIKLGEKLDKQTQDLQQSYQRTKRAMDATIETMSKIVEAKDPYTAGHQQRVSQLSTTIAKELNFSKDKIEGIRIASLIHDIGKIGTPTEILSKPTKLSDIEFSLIKDHSRIGYDILKSIDFSYPVAQIVLQHHERLDGSGYPNNLKGDKIFLEAKIIGIADVVEAMSSHRPYRAALGIDKALEEISQNRGTLYDPEVVGVCLKLFKEKRFKFE